MIYEDIVDLYFISFSGLYDGNVCVYNAQLSLESSYQYKSDSVRDKHSNIVWEVRIPKYPFQLNLSIFEMWWVLLLHI